MKIVAWLASSLVCAGLVACSPGAPLAPSPSVSTSVPIASVPATPTSLATPVATRVPTARPLVTPSGTITLTVWMADDIAPGASPAGRIFRNQIDAFTAANSNIHIEIIPKKASGKGGLLDFLTTTRAIVPARMPDLIALDMSEVPFAAELGILQPLDGLLPAELSADFFPFASAAARYRNRWVAFPFAVNVEHLVYNKAVIRLVPKTWEDFTKQKGALLLPLGGDDAFLVQYFALGASLTDAANQTAIDSNATAQVLSFVKRAHDLGLIPEAASGLKTVDEVWPMFAAGQVPMAQVSASRYLNERSKLPNAGYAAIPSQEGRVSTLADGWALGVVTPDPTRQAATARFVQWIVQGERLAPWLRAVRLLPASRAAIVLSVDPPEYATFLRDQLEHATSLPSPSTYNKQSEAWRAAISAVWKGQMTPEEAARNAAATK
ncbi:MAG TPA: extracellular solute-binding protein [Anaerolineae bacterium]